MAEHRIAMFEGRRFAPILAGKTMESDILVTVIENDVVRLVPHAEESESWKRAVFEPLGLPPIEGWLPFGHVGEPAAPGPSAPVLVGAFAWRAARFEMRAASGGAETDPPLIAEFLIAQAMVENAIAPDPAQLDPMAAFAFRRALPGSDALGPYLVDSAEWAADLDAVADERRRPAHRRLPLDQIGCAERLLRACERELAAFAAARPEAAEGDPFVPSWLDLHMARMIGPKAAFLAALAEEPGPDRPLAEVLAEAGLAQAEIDALLARRATELVVDGAPLAAGAARAAARGRLGPALAQAHEILKAHFPGFIAPPASAETPWMPKAEAELALWTAKGWDETAPEAQARITDYFAATDPTIPPTSPWCGGFAAFCVAAAGATPPEGAARAANWAGWGEVEVRPGGAVPRGALALMRPEPGTASSGHVCFVADWGDGETFAALGGNQGDKVKLSNFRKDKIRAIRAMAEPAAAPPDDGARLTLARTLWGEARGEGVKGMEAVASVILNRASAGRFGDGVSGVCLAPLQFSCWNANDPNRPKLAALTEAAGDAAFRAALDVAGRALGGALADPTGGALHYHAASIAPPKWARSFESRLRIGDHLFYTGIA